MWRKCLALALASLMLLACAACGPVSDDTSSAAPTTPGPFASARRIMTVDDLDYRNEGFFVVAPGEVLVFITYMESIDAAAMRANTIIQVGWAAEAVGHDLSLEYTGEMLRRESGFKFTHREDYGFGVAVREVWMLSEDEYTAAFSAMLAAARGAQEKEYWLLPSYEDDRGHFSLLYDRSASFTVDLYLPEQLRPNAEAIHMSTALMREYFPFLGTGL